MSNVHFQWQINEIFCTMTKGSCDHSNRFGDAECYAQRRSHSDHWRIRVLSVWEIGQTVVKLAEAFCSTTKCRICGRTFIEHWPKTNEKKDISLLRELSWGHDALLSEYSDNAFWWSVLTWADFFGVWIWKCVPMWYMVPKKLWLRTFWSHVLIVMAG